MNEPKAGRVEIITLGDCYVSVDGRMINHPWNFVRVLTYVLLEGRGMAVSRRRLRDLLWSDSNPEQASADSRQTIARIRRLQARHNFELLLIGPQEAWLNIASGAYFDLAEFVLLIDEPTPTDWTRLCEIYTGELLAPLRAASEAYEEWLAYQRSKIRHQFVSAISQAVLPDSGLSPRERHACALRLLQVDPYHEGAQRARMYDAAANGQYSLVRQLFEEFSAKLRRELNVGPDEETVRLYERLLGGAGVGMHSQK